MGLKAAMRIEVSTPLQGPKYGYGIVPTMLSVHAFWRLQWGQQGERVNGSLKPFASFLAQTCNPHWLNILQTS